MEIRFNKADICGIGYGVRNIAGRTFIYGFAENRGIEEELLMNTLKHFGTEYSIDDILEAEVVAESGEKLKDIVVYCTNLPYSEYEQTERQKDYDARKQAERDFLKYMRGKMSRAMKESGVPNSMIGFLLNATVPAVGIQRLNKVK